MALNAVLDILLGVGVVLGVTALTGYFVAQEFGYVAVDRARLRVRAGAGDAAARRAWTSQPGHHSCSLALSWGSR